MFEEETSERHPYDCDCIYCSEPIATDQNEEPIEDIGGNVIPDRIEANQDRYWEEEIFRTFRNEEP